MSAADIIKRLIEAGTPAELVAEVAVMFGRAEGDRMARLAEIDARRTKEREKKRRQRANVSPDVPGTEGDNGGQSGTTGVVPGTSGDISRAPARPTEQLPPTLNQEPPKKAPPSGGPKKGSRGERIPDAWVPDLNAAAVEGLSRPEAEREAARFRDYWRGKPGSAGLKADWPATWRNWCRKAADDRRGRAPPSGPVNGAAAFARHLREGLYDAELGITDDDQHASTDPSVIDLRAAAGGGR